MTTANANRGSLTINAQFAGDLPPNALIDFTAPTDESLDVNLAGTATDDVGVDRVQVSMQDRDTGRYLQANGTMAAAIAYRQATLGTPGGTATTWSLMILRTALIVAIVLNNGLDNRTWPGFRLSDYF